MYDVAKVRIKPQISKAAGGLGQMKGIRSFFRKLMMWNQKGAFAGSKGVVSSFILFYYLGA